MAEHELEKLLGGFAADQLTPEERRLLFTAALRDQQLFNALADEQALKELLADPAVRRRLLESLHQTQASGGGGSRTWFEWFKRPTGPAWAYGLAAAVLAIVLGTRIYQDSVKQAARLASEETTTPASPAAPRSSHTPPPQPAEPQLKANGNAAPAAVDKKDKLFDKAARLERSSPSKPLEPLSSAPRDTLKSSERDATLQQGQIPVPGAGQAQDERADTAGRTSPTNNSFPGPATLERAPRQGIANAPAAAGSTEPGLSARALFYVEALEPAAEPEYRSQSAASDRTRVEPKTAEAPKTDKKRAERSSGLPGKLERVSPPEKRLGVRYSLIMAGPGGIDMEVDPATPVGKENLPRLAIQTTEPGYLYLLREDPSGKRTLLFPPSGQAGITGRSTFAVTLSGLFQEEEPDRGDIRLLLVFSRRPQDAVSGLPSAKQASPLLIEQVDPGQPGATAEQAVYVMSRDPSLALLSVAIPLTVH